MKKILITIALALFILPASYSQFTKIGAATGYNYNYHFNNEQFSDHLVTKLPFIAVNAVYEVNLPFHLVPRLNVYIPNITKEDFGGGTIYKTTTSGISLDIDGHYVFNSLDQMELYGLAGANIIFVRRKFVEKLDGTIIFEEDPTWDTNLGFNLGIGGYLKVKDEFDLFWEAKAILASQIQIVGTFGILLNMEYLWSKEKDSGY